MEGQRVRVSAVRGRVRYKRITSSWRAAHPQTGRVRLIGNRSGSDVLFPSAPAFYRRKKLPKSMFAKRRHSRERRLATGRVMTARFAEKLEREHSLKT